MNVNLSTIIFGWTKPLGTVDHLLSKVLEYAEESGVPEAEMLEWRLAPDMFPLRDQAIFVCNLTRQWAARAADKPVPPDFSAQSLAELKQATKEARQFIDALDPAQFAGRDDVIFEMDLGVVKPNMPIGQWIIGFANTNILFHTSILYAILRSRGIAIGKRDLFAGGL